MTQLRNVVPARYRWAEVGVPVRGEGGSRSTVSRTPWLIGTEWVLGLASSTTPQSCDSVKAAPAWTCSRNCGWESDFPPSGRDVLDVYCPDCLEENREEEEEEDRFIALTNWYGPVRFYEPSITLHLDRRLITIAPHEGRVPHREYIDIWEVLVSPDTLPRELHRLLEKSWFTPPLQLALLRALKDSGILFEIGYPEGKMLESGGQQEE